MTGGGLMLLLKSLFRGHLWRHQLILVKLCVIVVQFHGNGK